MSVPEKSTLEVPVDKIAEAPWNANVMSPEIFKQLLEDMRGAGPAGISPIDVAPSTEITGQPGYVTIDGAHRLRAARQLGWTTVPVFIHQDVVNESEARLFNYKRDAERGEVDQFRLAETFKWYTDQGLDQQKIAVLFGLERSTVSKRLSLLHLDPGVKKKFEEDGLTVSHLEPIATLEPTLQKQVLKQWKDYSWGWRTWDSPPSVKQVTNIVDGVKRQEAAKNKWLETVAKSKFPKCPKCKQDPVLPQGGGYYGEAEIHVRCGQGHEWSRRTGKTPDEEALSAIQTAGGQPVRKKGPNLPPQHVKTEHQPFEYNEAMVEFFRKLWPEIKRAGLVRLEGELKNGKSFVLDYDADRENYGGSFVYAIGSGGRDPEIAFAVEQIKSKNYTDKGLYSRVKSYGQQFYRQFKTKKELQEFQAQTEKFLAEYGKLPRGTGKAKK